VQLLVYDLGGGTFDVAIVQGVGGTVNVVGHGGINTLGGADFDRRVVNEIVCPGSSISRPAGRLAEGSDVLACPQDRNAEKAKIERAQPTTRISADENQLSSRDQAGNLDIPFDRPQLENLVFDQLELSIDDCRKLHRENGDQPGDIDRVVFIGGPTRMPILRSQSDN
jgi:molecular chaperone DnaK